MDHQFLPLPPLPLLADEGSSLLMTAKRARKLTLCSKITNDVLAHTLVMPRLAKLKPEVTLHAHLMYPSVPGRILCPTVVVPYNWREPDPCVCMLA